MINTYTCTTNEKINIQEYYIPKRETENSKHLLLTTVNKYP